MGDVGKLLNNQKFDHVNVSKTISWTGFSKMFLSDFPTSPIDDNVCHIPSMKWFLRHSRDQIFGC